MDELIEQIGRGAISFVRQNAFWFAFLVPIFVVTFLPMGGPAQVLVIVVVFLCEAIAYALYRRRESS